MQLGKRPERRQDPDGMMTARRHDHNPRRRQAALPAAQAGSPGGAEDTPQPRQQGTAGGPAHAGQRANHNNGSPAPMFRHSPPRSTASPRTRRPATIQPRHQDRPTARNSAHSATTADAIQLYTPSPTTARQDARQRPTLDTLTGSGSHTPTGSTPDAIPARTPPADV